MTPTPPSTNSSSAGHSPDYRVVRKRNRVPLSCGPCRHRKLKCNRSNPCENCVKRGDAVSCNYAQASSRKKNSPQQSSSNSPDDMQNRIDRLEGLVLSLMTNGSQSAGPAAAMAAISGESSAGSAGPSHELDIDEEGMGLEESDTEQVTKSFGVMKMDNNKSYYMGNAHWASILNDISEVRNFFSTHKKQFEEQFEKVKAARPPTDVPGSTLLFGVMKPMSRGEIMSALPSKYTTDLLVTRYFNCYDPATHILHGPTFQAQYNKHWEDPSQTELVWIAMLFAMMRLAMLSYYNEGDEPPEFRGKSMDMAGGFRNSVAQCLTLADYTKPHPYLIEALVFHLHGDFSQSRETDVSIWVLAGVITRLAMRSGYHRDSKMFPNITPFQGEMRRRVWSFVRQADLLFSFQVGLPSMIRSTDSDTELPSNLYDDDFDEDCKELPPSRPLSEPTPISYLIAKARLTYAFGRVIEQSSAISNTSYENVMEADAELRQARDLIPPHLKIRPMEDCQLDPCNLIMSRFAVKAVYDKAQCVLHRPYLARARENPRFTYSRRTCIDSAMELLEVQGLLHTELRKGRLRTRQSKITSLSSADFLLSATVVSLDLYQGLQMQVSGRPSGDTYTWGRERREEMMTALQRSKEIWDEMKDESMEAYKASSVLGVMLSKLLMVAPTLENSAGAATFEPQDEKQNAAMTLGLLSSGMSPMNPGPPPFADPMFKMSDSPMPIGAGTSAEMPGGALSPFSSMFGQMPDMQVNLDWDAWDTYLQNPTLDSSNQFWPMMDAQRQPTPQSGGMSQPSVSSPLASTRVPSMSSSGTAPGLQRLPTMFTPPSNSPDSGVPPVSGHGLRRAVCRLQLSPATPVSSIASRTLSQSKCGSSTSLFTARTVNSATQMRWNSERPSIRYTKPRGFDEVKGWEQLEERAASRPVAPRQPRRTNMREQASPKNTVYVGNLFFDVTAEDLRSKFEQFGVVENSVVVHDSRGLSKGFGYVTFSATEEAANAIRGGNETIFEGRQITVQFANTVYRAQSEERPSLTLFIGNIPYELTDQDLQNLFEDIKGVDDIRVPVDRRTGLPRGFAHVDFIDQLSATDGKEKLSRRAPYGRKLNVSYARTKVMSLEFREQTNQRKLEKKKKALEKKDRDAREREIQEAQEPNWKE
ncbi:hypothetical protein PENANT_c003G08153 [Penicillium antarcticum]|uniref:Zn(2)-C6 fungal-type domain-containing protein n=1 Tax=Penicillium antarcticum TaxID=416450 RepID=A0A1V6QIQ8_9EURO|nr:uncharacterized protein N7508_005814 [Penicillium antarcticum]KAJ5306799.1 hypothetical protein N7508_005814 [Penicillium antarcticum]OQD88882.1 hypothetical protein PENANT_c003G08153 [Penicillium antarcticum]